MKKVPVKRYAVYPALPSPMFIVDGEPYFNIDNSILKDYFSTSYHLDRGYDELWYYIQSENIIMLKEYCDKKDIVLISCKGVENLLLYSDKCECEPFESMLRCGVKYKTRVADGMLDEDTDLVRYCDMVENYFTIPKISYTADKDYIRMFSYHTACCMYVSDVLKLFSDAYNMVDMVIQGTLSRYTITYYDYKKNDFTAIIQFEHIRRFFVALGIDKSNWLPVWRRIVKCYKAYVGADYGNNN